ncbi:NADH-quinone oxidoreductase subunit N [Roseivirga sp. BDSF3-8]|uniref:NADH-quinone oxidoreductase subunit N n=1 Tax=Roseivirga sp. BDSF3-8 TaxID=3241598 RepID=UPI003532481B
MQHTASISPLSSKLDAITDSLPLFLPEFTIIATFILVLVTGLLVKKEGKKGLPQATLPLLMLCGLGAAFYFLAGQWHILAEPADIFLQMAHADRLSVFMKGLFLLATAGTVIINRSYHRHPEHAARTPEFYLLLTGLLLGSMVMSMATNMLLLFLSIEIVSISAYLLTGFLRNARSAEAGIKYLIFGATASSLMLFGMSLLYGFSGTLTFTDSVFVQNLAEVPPIPVLIGNLLVLCGLFFKISLIPLHIWAPDVYEGGPLPAVALFSIVPKLAGLAVLLRFFAIIMSTASPLPDTMDWQTLLVFAGIATLLVGNLAALWQQSVRRLMAYSSIAHGGFMLAALLAYSDTGTESLLFYAAIYLIMNLAAFQWLAYFENKYGVRHVRGFAGLFRQEPLAAVCLLIVMIALTGLPPTAGFTAKLLVFGGLWDSYSATGQSALMALLLTGLFSTIAALFYYLKIPYFLFFRMPEKEHAVPAAAGGRDSKSGLWAGTIFTLPLLLFFVKADWLSDIIRMVNFVLQ